MVQVKFYSYIEIVDIETGEILTKSMFERKNMRIIKKEITRTFKKDINGNTYGKTKSQWQVKTNEQTKIKF